MTNDPKTSQKTATPKPASAPITPKAGLKIASGLRAGMAVIRNMV